MRGVTDAADELTHDAQTAAAGDRAAGRRQIASDDLQQRGLARAIRSYQGDHGALTNAEGHVVEQHAPVGQVITRPRQDRHVPWSAMLGATP